MFSINRFHNVSRDMFTGGAPRLCALQVVASHPHAASVQYIGMRFMFVQLVFDRMRQKPNKQGNTEQKRDNSSKHKKSFLNVTYGVVGTKNGRGCPWGGWQVKFLAGVGRQATFWFLAGLGWALASIVLPWLVIPGPVSRLGLGQL